MTDSPRWERESHEDLSAPGPPPQDTVEMDAVAGRLVDPGELSDPPEYEHELDPELDPDELDPDELAPRLAGARESLAASRERGLDSLGVARERAQDRLAATRERASTQLSAGRASAREWLAVARRWLSGAAGSIASTTGRVGRWVAALDRRPEFDLHGRRDPVAELTAGASPDRPQEASSDHELPGRFPIVLRGYERGAVERHLSQLETELSRLREHVDPPLSISEEIERLGEQTASILIVAHDTANETARRAQEQAARAVIDAADDAERITAEAQRRLRELDDETDAVWRERQRLLEDVREVSTTLATLVDSAGERFPAGEPDPAPATAE